MNSKKVIYQILVAVVIAFTFVSSIFLWKIEFIRKIYFSDWLTVALNGFILVLFLIGIIQLLLVFRRYAFEEIQLDFFIRGKESHDDSIMRRISPSSLIYQRHATIKKLYDRRSPINHGAISSVMIAEESTYQSIPKFINNVLILTGVFGTIVSLILALVGASTMLESVTADKGIDVMLLGMNTALTTTATAIGCFFLFSFFYQKLTDVQTHLFSRIENAVMMYIVPEFSFDTDTVNLKTEGLIKDLKELIINELREVIVDLKRGSSYVENTLAGLDTFNTQSLKKMDVLISQHGSNMEKLDDIINSLDNMRAVIKDGFRLDH